MGGIAAQAQTITVYLVAMAGIVAITAVAIRLLPAVSNRVLTGEQSRKHALDGVRGILALSVMLHHTLLGYLANGHPLDPVLRAYPFVSQLGSGSVALFFMISAYLFGGRLLRNAGRLDMLGFAYNRVMRIVPLYVFAVGLVVLIAFAARHFSLIDPPATLLRQIARHLMFGFVSRRDINGFPAAMLLGQVWSLRYEWLLYAVIPIMALLYRRIPYAAMLYLPLAVIALLWSPLFWFFVAGIAGAQLATFDSPAQRRAWQLAGVVTLLALPFASPESSDWPQALLLVPTFVAILQAHRWFALLGAKPLRYLGEISFSIYLLHGTFLYLFGALTGVVWARLGWPLFTLANITLGILVVAGSTATFLFIEKPLMHARLPRKA